MVFAPPPIACLNGVRPAIASRSRTGDWDSCESVAAGQVREEPESEQSTVPERSISLRTEPSLF